MRLVLLLVVSLVIGSESFVGVETDSLVNSCNSIRKANRKGPLTKDERLTSAAQDHANFMARYRLVMIAGPNGIPTYHSPAFNHDCNNGSGYRRRKYGWTSGGQEIIAMQPKGWRANCWESWKFSPSHYGAILGNHTHCGFAQAVSEDGCIYSVGVFGTK